MTVYEAKTYYDFVEYLMRAELGPKRRGAVKMIASKLKCHSTFVSQVVHRKAHFNHDQAARFCVYANLSIEETEFFMDLLNRDRSGSPEARKIFQGCIDKKLEERKALQTRYKITPELSSAQEIAFFKMWPTPLVHSALQIPGMTTIDAIAQVLEMDDHVVQESLDTLEAVGVVEKAGEHWRLLKGFIHLDSASPLNDSHQASCRIKTAALLQERKKTREHTHASAILCISTHAAEEIREILLNDMEKIRKKVKPAEPERIYMFCIDFYPLS